MVLSPLKALLSAQALLSIASLSNAQQYVGATINTGLPAVPGSEITYFNIKDANNKNTTLINYMSLNSTSQRPNPKLLKRAVIVIHGLNRDPGTYMSNMLSALSQVTGHSDVNTDSVAIVAPYFTNGDDKGVGYPWDTTKGGSYTSVLVWKGSQWASGANNQYPKTQTTVSSYAVLDQLTQYFDNKTAFPNINQIVIAGHSLGAQTVQRYCEVGTNLGTKTPIVYWIGNPNSYGWMSTDRPVDYSSCSTYDDWRDGLNSYTNTYGSALVASGRSNVLANYNTKSIAYARGTLDLGDDSSGCEPGTTGAERNERFFNFIKSFPPTSSCTIDYVQMGHDAGGMFAAPAGQARLFLDNFDGSGSKAYDYGYPRRQAGDDPYPDPSQSSTIAAVNPGTFNGMTYQGCYADQSPSSLALKAYSSDSNTIDLCTQTCASKGYTIAGLEYGSECWCGNSMNYRARKTTDQGCTMTCSGNSSQSCGSSYRLSVFSSGTVTIDTKPVSPAQVGSFSLLGCYSEAKSGRALSDKSTSQSGMTVENCALYCSGYNYFGVEYGVECYCGNTVACSSVSSLATNCSMTCGGNSTEYCGNGGYLNITATSSTVSASTTTTGSATTTVSASSTTSATASSTALACPAANGTTYTTKNSKSYLIECYTDHSHHFRHFDIIILVYKRFCHELLHDWFLRQFVCV
ncbi:wsc-domain-containing protein [Neofusicoccum parvum]|nr:wsc-domain-containing protein [Neofusicoccum parvum]